MLLCVALVVPSRKVFFAPPPECKQDISRMGVTRPGYTASALLRATPEIWDV